MQEKINRIWDYSLYLQLLASFSNELDFDEFNSFSQEFYTFIKNSSNNEIEKKLVIYTEKLEQYSSKIKNKYPLKKDFTIIAKEWNDLFKKNKEVLSNGIEIGWLEQFFDLKHFYKYDYYPYHFKIGLVTHKNKGEIEERFLLEDSFKSLYKAEKYFNLLNNYAQKQKAIHKKQGMIKFDNETLSDLNIIKFEISFYSRLTIISFYSFLECFVNSIGFDIFYRRKDILTEDEKNILKGSKKGRFLNLKFKIEAYQKIIRSDKTAKIVLSDDYQISEPFKTIFNVYEDLRNSSVHYSPEKTKIWIKPDDWFLKAQEFSKLTVEASMLIWNICHETKKGPDYLGRFNYKKLYESASQNIERIDEIKKNWL
ncbi:hypothetical protein [Flavobacterium sp.]|uniref:hypothetical protein n=1 Tax=Flavobacterium sp. TaxID=239 RepID=UPI0026135754|nr:hypothetical protein [Flavobacterium sp.]